MVQGIDNASKQRSYKGTNLQFSILIEVEKLTTHQDLTFFHLKESSRIGLSFFLLENHDSVSIDVSFFNF
jgi:hypothetical protein